MSELLPDDQRVALLERIARLATELCVSVDKAAEDIGGERPALEILRDIGPLTGQLEKLGPEPAAGVGVIDLAGSSLHSKEWNPLAVNLEILDSIVRFAYANGYHELGYNIVGEVRAQAAAPRWTCTLCGGLVDLSNAEMPTA
jgi:hypothetical protein